MPKPRRNKAKIQDEEEGGHLEIVEGASNTQKSRGNTRKIRRRDCHTEDLRETTVRALNGHETL